MRLAMYLSELILLHCVLESLLHSTLNARELFGYENTVMCC